MIPKAPPPNIQAPPPKKILEEDPPLNPEDALIPEDNPDTIQDEDPFETPPYEAPEPGEGP